MGVDLYLDPTTNDLAFDDNLELRLVGGDDVVGQYSQESSEGELVAQRIRYRLQTHTGEWFLDETVGVDWLGEIMVKAPDLSVVRAELLAVVATTDGVNSVREFTLSVNALTRHLTVSFEVDTVDALLLATGTLPDIDIVVT